MSKKKKKPLKILFGLVIFITLPSLLFCGYIYFKHHEELPTGLEGEKADILATKMLDALNKKAFDSTNVFEWTYKSRRHYKWEKLKNCCEVYWEDKKVKLFFDNSTPNQAYVHSFKVDGELADELIKDAKKYFHKDAFWVFAPYRVFDDNVKRAYVNTAQGKALLVTYPNRGAYLWHLDNNGTPKSFKMWDDQTPIDGLEASWNTWTTTETGAKLPTGHEILFFGMEITDIKGMY
ncbi:hypothetical protein [Seonamhaeicola marinus]|uniref:Uncharacterized protein n=1 Tax=Seonamhaeicola marinus TaxID=1912246 RepID=A0A5D0I4U0_9FLAO|nr:hypothetical protein [Seonamhaeicola marinus]TYA78763.1 hypothetical protein FUA24_10450 [Seonamhaeicola marinus]